MKNRRGGNSGRQVAKIASLFDELAPEELGEAEEELRALELDPGAIGERLEHLAIKELRAGILATHRNAGCESRARTSTSRAS